MRGCMVLDGGRRRSTLYFEALVIVGVFVIPLTSSAILVFRGEYSAANLPSPGFYFGYLFVWELTLLGLLWHVIRLNSEGLAAFTRPFSRWDFLLGLLLCVAFVISYYGVLLVIGLIVPSLLTQGLAPPNIDWLRVSISPLYVAAVLVNPFAEEAFLRGFLQTRLRQVGWPSVPTAIFSAALQAGYHLYQGVTHTLAVALGFLILALFYERTGRLWPVILGHVILDASMLFMLAK